MRDQTLAEALEASTTSLMGKSTMPWMYFLKCSDDSYYVGSTILDIADRVKQHEDGKGSVYTSPKAPR